MPIEYMNNGLYHRYYEIINGEKFFIPSKCPAHASIVGRIILAVGKNLIENERGYFFGNIDVQFDDKNIFVPSLVVVLKSNEKILAGQKNIYGAPDMVVEVLSNSTRKKDLTIKKDTYEAQGVREYWIVDPRAKSVMVYILQDGKYFLDDVYLLLNEEDLNLLDEEEKADVKYKVPVSILDGLEIPIEFIFSWGY
ncbi:MAG: Uma2 family endonuclease [Selenomonadaceae bacterium]|nr:Uma2 family endonuclease [Selenomonadaceae bacterium]